VNRGGQRRQFAKGFYFGLGVVWPVISSLLLLMLGMGLMAGRFEKWSIGDTIYFAFISGLTIGYGDLAPKTVVARILAIIIGVCGILLMGLVAAVAVKALTAVTESGHDKPNP
jgi:hypothetical protein